MLVADTIVVAPDGAVLGKPRDDDEGVAMLERLAGATHHVSTHFVLGALTAARAPALRPCYAQTVTTRVTFRAIAPREIAAYVASGEGRDKAGSYAVQGNAACLRRANRRELHERGRPADLRGARRPARDRLAPVPLTTPLTTSSRRGSRSGEAWSPTSPTFR